MTLSEAKAILPNIEVRDVIANWKHIVKGHYNFKDPGKAPDEYEGEKSFFTFDGYMELISAIHDVCQTTAGRDKTFSKAAAVDRFLVFKEAKSSAVIGKTSGGEDCTWVCIVVEKTKGFKDKGKVVTSFPVKKASGDALK